jgi:hypothetical protein
MSCFNKIELLINNYSQKDWSVFGVYNSESEKSFESSIVDFVTTNSRELVVEFVRFLIAGDILISDDINGRIGVLKDSLNSASIPDAPFESSSALILTQVSKSYKNWLGSLESFNVQILHHIEEYGSHWAVELFKESNIDAYPLGFLVDYSLALKDVFKLVYIDFFLSFNIENQIPNLLIIRDKLQSKEFKRVLSNEGFIRNLLVEKCNLLINKIEKANNRKYKFLFDGYEYLEHKNIENLDQYIVDFNDKGQLDALNLVIQRKGSAMWSFKDYYVRMKVLKERTQSTIDAQNIYESFDKLEDISSSFDRWAHSISKVFLYNNYISLVLSDESINLDRIKATYIEVCASHENVGIRNYFPFLKISQTIIMLINQKVSTITLDEINKHTELLEQSNKSLRASYEWSKAHLNWAFQPSFDECRCEINGVVIFTASGYSTPVDYSYVEGQIQKVKEDSAIVKGFSSTLILNDKILEKSKETADAKIEELQKENRELLKKNVEVLSIFAAIVLFVVGNIQLFIQLTTLKSALMFMLVFAYVISMFVLLIRLTTRNYPDVRKGISWIKVLKFNLFESIHLGLMVVATVAILFILFFSKDIILANKDNSKEKDGKVMVDIRNHADPMIQNHANPVQKR